MKTYKLYNRYKDNISLEQVDGDTYKLNLPEGSSDMIRVLFGENYKVEAVDPSGGPFIKAGCSIDLYEDATFRKSVKAKVSRISLNKNSYLIDLKFKE